MSKCNVIFSFLARLKWNFKLHIVLLFTISFLFPLRYFISNCFLQAQASADTNNCQVPWLKFLHQWRSPDSWELTPRKSFKDFMQRPLKRQSQISAQYFAWSQKFSSFFPPLQQFIHGDPYKTVKNTIPRL